LLGTKIGYNYFHPKKNFHLVAALIYSDLYLRELLEQCLPQKNVPPKYFRY